MAKQKTAFQRFVFVAKEEQPQADRLFESKKLRTTQPLVFVSISVLCACAISQYLPASWAESFIVCAKAGLAICCLSTLFFGAYELLTQKQTEKSTRWFLTLLIHLGFFCLFSLWHALHWWALLPGDISFYANDEKQPVAIRGKIVSLPEWVLKEGSFLAHEEDKYLTRFVLKVEAIRDRQEWISASGKTILYLDETTESFLTGQRVTVYGTLQTIRKPHNPGEFDYASYLRSQQIRCQVSAKGQTAIYIESSASPWDLRSRIAAFRMRAVKFFQRTCSEQTAEVLNALLLGQRSMVRRTTYQKFIETGTVHLLAISGMHVGILIGLIIGVMRLFHAPHGIIWVGLTICLILYALLVGSKTPVMRAAVLAIVFYLSIWRGSQVQFANSLAAAIIILAIIAPGQLFHAGTMLSFIAVAILYRFITAPRLEVRLFHLDPEVFDTHNFQKLSQRARRNREIEMKIARVKQAINLIFTWLCRALIASFCVWIFTLPIVMISFHIVSPISVLLNILLTIPITIAMTFSLVSVLLFSLSEPLASIVLWPAEESIECLLALLNLCERFGYRAIWVPAGSRVWTGLFYSGIMLGLTQWNRLHLRWVFSLLAAWFLVAWVCFYIPIRNAGDRCTFLSVGHGCCCVMELEDGSCFLYDLGKLGDGHTAGEIVSRYLWERRIHTINGVFLSHADQDHYNGLPFLLDRFKVECIYTSPYFFLSKDEKVQHLRKTVERFEIPIQVYAKGEQVIREPNYSFSILHPSRETALETDNANSLVVLVNLNGLQVLLTGDLEPPGTEFLLQQEFDFQQDELDVLLIPHHGSNASSPDLFIHTFAARVAIVSQGKVRSESHLREKYLEQCQHYYSTEQHGAITIQWIEGRLDIETVLCE